MTAIIKTQNWNAVPMSVSIEPIGVGFTIGVRQTLSVSSTKYDLGDEIMLFPDGMNIMISLRGEQPDFYDTIDIKIDGIEQDW